MTFIRNCIIFGIFFVFQSYGVYSEEAQFKGSKQAAKKASSASVAKAQTTADVVTVGQIFYKEKTDAIIYADRKLNGTMNVCNSNGERIVHYFEELSEEVFTIIVPVKGNNSQYILGSDLNLRLLTLNDTNYTISSPVMTFDDPNFIIHAAKCDLSGTMYILLVGTNEDNMHIGQFYKVRNGQATFVMDIDNTPRDFRFNVDDTFMYLINDTTITEYRFHSSLGVFDDCRIVFDSKTLPMLRNSIMTSLALDKKDPPTFFIPASGKSPYVVEIRKGKLANVSNMYSKNLTFITNVPSEPRKLVGAIDTSPTGSYQCDIQPAPQGETDGLPDIPVVW